MTQPEAPGATEEQLRERLALLSVLHRAAVIRTANEQKNVDALSSAIGDARLAIQMVCAHPIGQRSQWLVHRDEKLLGGDSLCDRGHGGERWGKCCDPVLEEQCDACDLVLVRKESPHESEMSLTARRARFTAEASNAAA